MPLTLSADERRALQVAQAHSHIVRHWRRYQAVLLRGEGMPVVTIAQTLNCTETSVHNWVAAWRAEGLAGVAEGIHAGKARRLDVAAEAALQVLLSEGDPQARGYAATGWTVPLLRTLHRLGWRWNRPKFVLGRPDPAYAEKKSRR
jgi:transposase